MIIQWIVFILASLAAIVFALLMITRKNPIHSAVCLIMNFLSVATLYVLLGREFIAISQVIIYAGAIMMLVVFTIMLISVEEVRKKPLLRVGAGGVIGIILTLLLLGYLGLGSFAGSLYGEKGNFTMETIREMGPFKAVGKLFMTQYLLPFELASVVLLVGIIGAVILAKKER
jgi:NADH-quinone oxidoreductase subunit J